ncbi:MAG: DEAD/DEAH box helicase [Rikenellaceae bacterium]
MYFDELDLDYDLLDAIEEMGFEQMTPVQEQTIPVILEGSDLIGCAQTGTGKTAAFALPLLNQLIVAREAADYDDSKCKAIIMVPTRELAMQIDTQFQGFAYYMPISTTVVYGGGDGKTWDVQRKGMCSGADIVIATPGRLLAHIESGAIDFSGVKHFILDEADRMLDMGFFDDIMRVVGELPKERQTIMFSATLPPKIRKMAKELLTEPKEINIAISKPSESIDQGIYVCHERQKLGIVDHLFSQPIEGKALIFSSSKLKVKELSYQLKRMKLNVGAMHSDLDQERREEVMLNYKNGKIDILVATDIVARGIDIDDIALVINFDVPHDPEDYIHRIGRTGRASATGRAITFVSEAEQGKFHKIEEFIERDVKQLEMPEELGKAPVYNPSAHPERGRGGSGRGGASRGGSNRGGSSRGGGSKSQNRGGKGSAERRPKQEKAPQGEVAAADTTVKTTSEGTPATNSENSGDKPKRKKRRFYRKPKAKATE